MTPEEEFELIAAEVKRLGDELVRANKRVRELEVRADHQAEALGALEKQLRDEPLARAS